MVSLLVFGRKNGLSKMMYKGWENEKVSVIYKTGYNQQGVVSYLSDKMIILGDTRMIPISNVALIKKIE